MLLIDPMPISVLHVSQSDAGGGSATSAYRIHDTLRSLGCRSRMLVGEQRTGDPDVRPLKRGTGWRLADRAVSELADRASLQYILYPSSFGLAGDAWFRTADVVQLYNLHGSYFSPTALPLLSRRKPVVWRLSDMWAFTGHSAYTYDCERWRTGCGACPYLAEYPALARDTTALLWKLKKAAYDRSRLTVVAPSRWIGRLAGESPLLGRFPQRFIPNGVDLDVFAAGRRAEARAALGIAPDARVVLFASLRLDERRKGGTLLRDALAAVDGPLELLVAGAGAADFGRPLRELGRLDDRGMAQAYAAADMYVHPAIAENLPNAAVESLACGTPVVAFDVGGVPDAVRHLETGWLAPTGDAGALAEGIRTLLGDAALRARLAVRCREVAVAEYGKAREAHDLLELYGELCEAA
jgi:glycosyltransferase involved in cell wall biosynthesis